MSDINKLRHRCFFDISVGTKNIGRIVFELFNDICPKTCDNFKCLCTGEAGIGKTTSKPLHYKNVIFHRVVQNFIIQSGDFSQYNGKGGESIYTGTFDDENFSMKHNKPFLLSMANRGKNTNGSQFFITLAPAPHLDGVHVVFGHVLSGFEVIKEIENQECNAEHKPIVDVMIANCGELIPQIKVKDKKKHKKDKRNKSEGELSTDDEDVKKREKTKRDKKNRHKKKELIKKEEEKKENEELNEFNHELIIKADEIPEIPANHFLLRANDEEQKIKDKLIKEEPIITESFYERRSRHFPISKSGRKIKGRGYMRYRTPTPEHQRSGSETPPHWRTAQSRLKSLKEVISVKQRSDQRDTKRTDRMKYDSRRNYRHSRYENYEYTKRDSLKRERLETNADNSNRESSTAVRKRVFTEEPPDSSKNGSVINAKHSKHSSSPKYFSDRHIKEHNKHKD